MKYVLKYVRKSKYLGFVRQEFKEFKDRFEVFYFLNNQKDIIEWKLYIEMKMSYTELLRGGENE